MSGVWYVGGVRDEWSVVCGWGERGVEWVCGRGEGDEWYVVCGRNEGDEWQRRSDTVELYTLKRLC